MIQNDVTVITTVHPGSRLKNTIDVCPKFETATDTMMLSKMFATFQRWRHIEY